jgi:hypothetical protein
VEEPWNLLAETLAQSALQEEGAEEVGSFEHRGRLEEVQMGAEAEEDEMLL